MRAFLVRTFLEGQEAGAEWSCSACGDVIRQVVELPPQVRAALTMLTMALGTDPSMELEAPGSILCQQCSAKLETLLELHQQHQKAAAIAAGGTR